MPAPNNRNFILPARGNYANLVASIGELLDGEMCYAIDHNRYYQKVGSALIGVHDEITPAGIRSGVDLAADSNVFTDAEKTKLTNIAENANNYSLVILDEDDLASDSATGVASQQSIKAYIDAEAATSDAADVALSARLDTLEADETTATAVAAVQADVDQNESDCDAADSALSARLDTLEADPTTATAVTAVQANVDTEKDRVDAILSAADADKDSFAEIVTLINSVDTTNDTAFAGYVTSNDAAVAAVQADVDQNEADSDAAELALSNRVDDLEADSATINDLANVAADVDQNEADSDAAELALSNRLDTLEADPTTATALAAVQADVDQNEADADAALALRAPLHAADATGTWTFSNTTEFQDSINVLMNCTADAFYGDGSNLTGLGSITTQDSDNVAITGGTINGIVLDGGVF
ncbi:MAG: hypothetical protein GY918_07225 [Gammaproteobacteria bacterium]|nr:hypothetical protein [Gammaproteobacteria bacterium]